MQFNKGESVSSGKVPHHPALTRTAITLTGIKCYTAELFSPDQGEAVPLAVTSENNQVQVIIPLKEVKRVAFIRMERKP